MNKEQISVFVNDRPVRIYRGMTVKHALLVLDNALYKAAQGGEIFIQDEKGFMVGLDGALRQEARLYTRQAKSSRGPGKRNE
jgi:hypothetical protein